MCRLVRLRIVIVLVLVVVALPARADDTPDPTHALSRADEARARQDLHALASAFGVEDEEKTVPSPALVEAKAPDHKTVADVADRGLDMVKGLVASISETLQKVAPHVWEVMIRQQYAKAIADLVVPTGLFLITLVYFLIIRKKWQVKPEFENRDWTNEYATWFWFAGVIPTCFLLIWGIWSVVALSNSIKYLINPEYYAVRDIITMLLRPEIVP